MLGLEYKSSRLGYTYPFYLWVYKSRVLVILASVFFAALLLGGGILEILVMTGSIEQARVNRYMLWVGVPILVLGLLCIVGITFIAYYLNEAKYRLINYARQLGDDPSKAKERYKELVFSQRSIKEAMDYVEGYRLRMEKELTRLRKKDGLGEMGFGYSDSSFEGLTIGFLKAFFLGAAISILTLGLGFPYALHIYVKWEQDNAMVSGCPKEYRGTVRMMYAQWGKWLLYSICSCFLFLLIIKKAVNRWVLENTYLKGGNMSLGTAYDTSVFASVGFSLLFKLLKWGTLGICSSLVETWRMGYEYRHLVHWGRRYEFRASGTLYFLKFLLWSWLSLITLGIFSLFVRVRHLKWEYSHLRMKEQLTLSRIY